MILKSIVARRFRGIKKEESITFTPSLNIVKGSDNEAGKSSLRIAITKALFQDPTSTSDDVHKLTRWGSEEPWETELEFETKAGHYRLSKSLKDKTGKLERIDALEKSITSKTAITAKITEFSGCPSEVFFESTACIAQDEMIRLIPAGAAPAERKNAFGTLTQRLQATLSGTQEIDVPNIMATLYNKAHRKEAKGPHWQIQGIAEQLNTLLRDKPEQERKISNLMDKRHELNHVKEQLEQIIKELPPKQELLEKNKSILSLEGEINKNKTQFTNFNRAKDFKRALDEASKDLEPFAHLSAAEAKITEINEAKSKLLDLEKQKTFIENESKSLPSHKAPAWMLIAGIMPLAGGVIAAIIGLVLRNYFYVGIGALVAISGLLLSFYYRQTSRKPITTASIGMPDLEAQTQHLKSLLEALGFYSYEEFEKELGVYQKKLVAEEKASTGLRIILGDEEWVKYEEENSDLDIQIRASQKELEKLLPFKLDPLELQKLESEVIKLETRKKELEGIKSGLDNFLSFTDADTDQLARIREEIEWLQKELEYWNRKQKVYDATRQALDEAHKQTLSRAATVLEKELSKYISTITDGRYTQVSINEQDLSIQTFSPEKQDWVSVLDLSRATQDQFYICARFALANLITEGKHPPLLLDDPFVNFHQKRLERTIPLLQELSKENQILLFTCSDAYDNYGNVISVD